MMPHTQPECPRCAEARAMHQAAQEKSAEMITGLRTRIAELEVIRDLARDNLSRARQAAAAFRETEAHEPFTAVVIVLTQVLGEEATR